MNEGADRTAAPLRKPVFSIWGVGTRSAMTEARTNRRFPPFWRHFLQMFAAMAVGMISADGSS